MSEVTLSQSPEMLTIAQVARRLGIATSYVYNLIDKGRLPNATQVIGPAGRPWAWRIPASDLDGIVIPKARKTIAAPLATTIKTRSGGRAQCWPLSEDEEARAYAIFCQRLDACYRAKVEPAQDWAEAKEEWESIPPPTRAEMFAPEAPDDRPAVFQSYPAYQSPRV